MKKTKEENYNDFKLLLNNKTDKQLSKEYISWRKYMDKYSSAYSWNANMQNPNELSDGDKITIIKDLLIKRNIEFLYL